MKRIVYSTSQLRRRSARIVAANEDEGPEFDEYSVEDLGDEDTFTDTLDDVADTVEDIQDSVDEVEEDDITIDMNNNITGHYIAECDTCHGVFISATIESDQVVEKVSGICPLCQKETEQYLKWVIKDARQE